ncbi:extracellular solute-binding protein [Cohnella laeviribosi]|jgi:putative aldouronate transport system substrate-binding protein|uniref:extracellular solute-binding protein n=1 Tax=Cohnella laeviribosi TaxID=380174 RepID=UPI000365F96F|nr:extracellular solute-binding protein [Cohnella laeviribosi]
MRQQKRKTAAVLLALAVSLAMLGACGKDSGKSAPADAKEAKKPEISVSIFDRGEVSAEEGSYESNRWTKWINENAPATVKWIPVPRNQSQQKLNTLIAAGEAPDLIWEYDRAYISTLASQGAIQPIDQYIDKYSTSYKAYLQAHPELKPYLTINGKLYAVASVRGIDTIANHGMWIRQDWLDKLGLKTPTTIDELLDAARKFKTDDPDGNGKADTYGIVFNANGYQIMRSLFFTHENQWYLNDGKLEFGRIADRYADVLAFEKTLFDEGLIDQEYITDKNAQRAKQFWTTGKAGIFLGSWDMPNEYSDLKKNDPSAKPVALEPVATPYGKNGLYQENAPYIYVTFNKDMKEQQAEAAVKFLDWMIDKGWQPLKLGEENVHYKLVNGVPQTIDPQKFRQEVFYAREYAVLNQYSPKPEWFPIMAAQDPISQEYAKAKADSLTVAMKNKYRRDIPFNPDLPEANQLISAFSPIAEQIEAKVVTGGAQMTPQAGLDELRKEWKRLGGDNVEKLVQEWYDQNKAGMK